MLTDLRAGFGSSEPGGFWGPGVAFRSRKRYGRTVAHTAQPERGPLSDSGRDETHQAARKFDLDQCGPDLKLLSCNRDRLCGIRQLLFIDSPPIT